MLGNETWEVAVPTVGMKVRIQYQPGCSSEMWDHGIWPFTNGVIGKIVGIRRDTSGKPGEHHYMVTSPQWSQSFQYFALHEMVPIGKASIDN